MGNKSGFSDHNSDEYNLVRLAFFQSVYPFPCSQPQRTVSITGFQWYNLSTILDRHEICMKLPTSISIMGFNWSNPKLISSSAHCFVCENQRHPTKSGVPINPVITNDSKLYTYIIYIYIYSQSSGFHKHAGMTSIFRSSNFRRDRITKCHYPTPRGITNGSKPWGSEFSSNLATGWADDLDLFSTFVGSWLFCLPCLGDLHSHQYKI